MRDNTRRFGCIARSYQKFSILAGLGQDEEEEWLPQGEDDCSDIFCNDSEGFFCATVFQRHQPRRFRACPPLAVVEPRARHG